MPICTGKGEAQAISWEYQSNNWMRLIYQRYQQVHTPGEGGRAIPSGLMAYVQAGSMGDKQAIGTECWVV